MNTVAARTRSDGKRTPSAILIPKRLKGTGDRSSKHKLQQDMDGTKYEQFVSSPLRHSQPAVLDISSYTRHVSPPRESEYQEFSKKTTLCTS
jgi:hypothetical protein